MTEGVSEDEDVVTSWKEMCNLHNWNSRKYARREFFALVYSMDVKIWGA